MTAIRAPLQGEVRVRGRTAEGPRVRIRRNALTSTGRERYLRRAVGESAPTPLDGSSVLEIRDSGGSVVRTLDPSAGDVTLDLQAPNDGQQLRYLWTDTSDQEYEVDEIRAQFSDGPDFNQITGVGFGERSGAVDLEVELTVSVSTSELHDANAGGLILEPLADLANAPTWWVAVVASDEITPDWPSDPDAVAGDEGFIFEAHPAAWSWDGTSERVEFVGTKTNDSGDSHTYQQYRINTQMDGQGEWITGWESPDAGAGELDNGAPCELTLRLSES